MVSSGNRISWHIISWVICSTSVTHGELIRLQSQHPSLNSGWSLWSRIVEYRLKWSVVCYYHCKSWAVYISVKVFTSPDNGQCFFFSLTVSLLNIRQWSWCIGYDPFATFITRFILWKNCSKSYWASVHWNLGTFVWIKISVQGVLSHLSLDLPECLLVLLRPRPFCVFLG